MSDLHEEVVGLVAAATRDDPPLAALSRRLEEPVRVGIAGRVNAGKSTLANALLGVALAPTDALETTRLPMWFRHGASPEVVAGGRQVRYARDGALRVDPEDLPPGASAVEVRWPAPALRELILVDTPGLASATGVPPAAMADVDAVVYLTRHLHPRDVGYLEAFVQGETSTGDPASTIAVLSRPDEVGGGGLDALARAEVVVQRLRDDPRVRRLCGGVVAVAGLLAEASVSMDEPTYQALLRCARDTDTELRSAEGFIRQGDRGERVALVDRLGLFGIRWCLNLLRREGAVGAAELALQLGVVSGLDDLRTTISERFTAGGRTLSAAAVLRQLEEALQRAAAREQPWATGHLRECERIRAGSVDLDRIAVLAAVRSGSVDLPSGSGEVHDLVRVLEGAPDTVSLDEAIQLWRVRAQHPLLDRTARLALDVTVRVLEHRRWALRA